MKQIERQELEWGEGLADRVDRALDRRLRLKDQQIKHKPKTNKQEHGSKQQFKSKEDFIYCNTFNKGRCDEANSHRGAMLAEIMYC